jgi:hypothetical protein
MKLASQPLAKCHAPLFGESQSWFVVQSACRLPVKKRKRSRASWQHEVELLFSFWPRGTGPSRGLVTVPSEVMSATNADEPENNNQAQRHAEQPK